MSVLLEACFSVLLINLPFGAWRSKVHKFSLKWFLAVHLPIPIIILIRIKLDLGWDWTTYPYLFASFFVGQWLGSKLAKHLHIVHFPRKRRVLNHQRIR